MDIVTYQMAKTLIEDTMAGAGAIKGDKGDPGPQGPSGEAGPAGEQGESGVTFTPSVSEDGVISWTNDGDLPNPDPVNIKGPPGGGTDFTPDDTLTLTDGTLGVATPVQGVYTQADYDALPEAQKNNGLYVISDDGGGAEGGSSGEIYSTEETRIGTWIDGKPLYRKTFETLSGYSATIQFDSSFTIRDIRGIIYTRNNTNVPINCFYDSSYYSAAWQDLIHGNIGIRTIGDVWINSPMIVTVEYTKNTDSATIQEVTE